VSVFGVEPFRIGGVERFSRELSLQLASEGWDSVLCFLAKPSEAVWRYLDLPNVTLEVLENCHQLGWQAAMDLRRVLHRHRPSVLHLHFTGPAGMYVYPWVGRLCSVPKVFCTDHTSHPEGYSPQPAPLWKQTVGRAITAGLSSLICVSDYGYKTSLTRGLCPPARVKRIYNGVELDQLAAPRAGIELRRRFRIPEDRLVILQVSWIIPQKGIPDLLKAASKVVLQNPSAHFLLVGEGEYREQYMKQAVEMGLEQNITWTGIVQDPVAEGVYAASDVVCQVSRWQEVFGWVIAEAMASSKPIVATRVGGIPELVKDGGTGFLVERRDCDAIAGRLIRLLADAELRQRMGMAGRRIAEAKFSQKLNIAYLLNLYEITARN
jgi:glycosyltransferase involved in cell wall biosynthesis